jgi:hypothetical protein
MQKRRCSSRCDRVGRAASALPQSASTPAIARSGRVLPRRPCSRRSSAAGAPRTSTRALASGANASAGTATSSRRRSTDGRPHRCPASGEEGARPRTVASLVFGSARVTLRAPALSEWLPRNRSRESEVR